MGSGQSQLSGNSLVRTTSNLRKIADQDVIQPLNELSDFIDVYKTTNSRDLVQKIQNYQKSNANKKNPIEMNNDIFDQVQKFHSELQKKIVNGDKRLVREDLTEFYNNDLKNLKDTILQDPGLKNNKPVIDNIFDGIIKIKGNSKFYEYKYVQLNMFMILFTQKLFNIFDKYTQEVLAVIIARDKEREHTMLNFLTEFVKALKDDNELSDFDDKQINEHLASMKVQMSEKSNEVEKIVKDLQAGTVKQLIEVLTQSEKNKEFNVMTRSNKNAN